MANEFIIKNGFHSKGDSQVTGSLGVSGSLQIQGIANVSASIAAAGGSTPTLQQVTTAGSSTSDQITTSNGINFSSDYITKLVSSTFKLNQGAEDISTEIIGFGGNTNAKFDDTDLQLTGSTGGVKIKGPITGDDQFTLPKLNVSASILNFTNNNYKINATDASSIIFNNDNRSVVTRIKGSDGLGSELQIGDKETLVSGSLYVKQFGITSSAGLLLGDASTNSVASTTNRILTPIFQSSGPGYPLLIQPGDSIAGSGGTGAHVYLQGGDATNASSAGSGGNVYIIGGTSSTTSSSTGSIFLKGNTVNLDNTSLSHYGNSTNNRVIISNDTDHVNIGVVSYNATGGGPFGIKFFADGVEAFKIEGASGQKATFQGSRSGQHTEVRATSGSFSYLRGQSPLIIDADNFSVTSTGEVSSGTGDGISTTSITASGDISLSSNPATINFTNGAGIRGRFNGSYPGMQLYSGNIATSKIWFWKGEAGSLSAPTASFNGGLIEDVRTLKSDGNVPLIIQGGNPSNDVNDGIRFQTADAGNTFQTRFEIESDGATSDAYFTNISGLGINDTTPTAMLDVNGNINTTSDITASGAISSSGTITGNSFVKGGGTSAQFLKADGSVDSSTYLTSAFPFTGDAQITGSLIVSGSGGLKVTGPLEVSMTASSGVVPLSIKTISDLSTDTIIQVRDDGGAFDLMTFDSEGRFNMRGTSTDTEGAGYYVSQGGVTGEHARMGFVSGKAQLSIAANGAADKFRVFVNGSQTSPMVGLTGRGTLALGTDTSAATLPNEARTNTMFIAIGTPPSTAEADNIQFFAQDVNSVAGTASPTFLTEDSQVLQLGVTSSLSYVSASAFKGDGSQLTNLPAGSTPTLDAVTAAGNVTSNAITAGIISGSAFKLNNANALSHTGNVLYVGNANDWTTVELGRETTDEIHANGIFKAEQLLKAEQNAQITGSLNITGSSEIIGSGSAIFQVEGSVGTLFSVDDGLDDVIFAANNVSGTPVISANADNTVKLGKLGGFGIVISGSTPAPNDSQAKIIITGSIHTSGSLGVGMAASSTIGRIDAKNDVVAFSTSDERLKDNITPIENALNKVSQVQGIEFDWIEKEGVHGNKGHDIGVIAQEIEKVLPEVVTTRDNGYKAVKYEKIIPLLVEAIKELQAEVQELKKDK